MFFFIFLKRVFNRFGNILPQKKNIYVDSVRKICLIQRVLWNFVAMKSENNEFSFWFFVGNSHRRNIFP